MQCGALCLQQKTVNRGTCLLKRSITQGAMTCLKTSREKRLNSLHGSVESVAETGEYCSVQLLGVERLAYPQQGCPKPLVSRCLPSSVLGAHDIM